LENWKDINEAMSKHMLNMKNRVFQIEYQNLVLMLNLFLKIGATIDASGNVKFREMSFLKYPKHCNERSYTYVENLLTQKFNQIF
jgi:hypothetical protein